VQAGLLLRNTILKPGHLALAERGAFKRSRQAQPSLTNVRSRIKFQDRFKTLKLAQDSALPVPGSAEHLAVVSPDYFRGGSG
jgi:hypothetical protein